MRPLSRFGAVLACLLLTASDSFGQGIYTFDAPNFTLGATTPLLNVAPNSGAPGLLTSFSAAPTLGGFTVSNVVLNPLFSGQMLYDPMLPVDVLTLTFNQPIFSISMDFAVEVPAALRLTDGPFVVNQPSMNIGPNFDFQGGTLIYSNPLSFSSVTLAALDPGMMPVLFGIDNVVVTPVPEPAAVFAIASISLGIGAYWRRKKKAALQVQQQ